MPMSLVEHAQEASSGLPAVRASFASIRVYEAGVCIISSSSVQSLANSLGINVKRLPTTNICSKVEARVGICGRESALSQAGRYLSGWVGLPVVRQLFGSRSELYVAVSLPIFSCTAVVR